MKRGTLLAVACVVAVFLAGGSAFAQQVSQVNVPFKFMAGKTAMDAGKYTVTINEDATVTFTPAKGQPVMLLPVTRLAEQTATADARFVFDRVGQEYRISEVWMGSIDGFLLNDLKEPHKHHIIKGEKKG